MRKCLFQIVSFFAILRQAQKYSSKAAFTLFHRQKNCFFALCFHALYIREDAPRQKIK